MSTSSQSCTKWATTTLGGNSNLLLAFLLSHEDLSSQQLRFTCNISFPFRERCLGDSPSKNDFNTRSCTSNLSSNCVSRLSSHHFFVNKTTDKVCLKPYICLQCVTILILRCKSMHTRRERVGFILRPLAPCFHLGPAPGSLAPSHPHLTIDTQCNLLTEHDALEPQLRGSVSSSQD